MACEPNERPACGKARDEIGGGGAGNRKRDSIIGRARGHRLYETRTLVVSRCHRRPRREASSYHISSSLSSLLHPQNSSTAPLRNSLPLAMAAVEPAGKNVPLQITEGANPTANVQRAVRDAARCRLAARSRKLTASRHR